MRSYSAQRLPLHHMQFAHWLLACSFTTVFLDADGQEPKDRTDEWALAMCINEDVKHANTKLSGVAVVGFHPLSGNKRTVNNNAELNNVLVT